MYKTDKTKMNENGRQNPLRYHFLQGYQEKASRGIGLSGRVGEVITVVKKEERQKPLERVERLRNKKKSQFTRRIHAHNRLIPTSSRAPQLRKESICFLTKAESIQLLRGASD